MFNAIHISFKYHRNLKLSTTYEFDNCFYISVFSGPQSIFLKSLLAYSMHLGNILL